MKLITEQTLKLGELITWIGENDIRSGDFRSTDHTRTVRVYNDGNISFISKSLFDPDDEFSIDGEQEVTKGTLFDSLLVICGYVDGSTRTLVKNDMSINTFLYHNTPVGAEVLSISSIDSEGVPTVIYTAKDGIPEDGVVRL